jgi:hypothetical protein
MVREQPLLERGAYCILIRRAVVMFLVIIGRGWDVEIVDTIA